MVYVLGGHTCSESRAEAMVYTFSSDSWSSLGNLPWANYDYSAAIIKQKNDERWLVIQARYQHHHHYYHHHYHPHHDGQVLSPDPLLEPGR